MRDWLLMSETWREWTVAGALLETDAGLLMVRNVRRGGAEDWSTPGGVVDADDASLLAGLEREVFEETGLRVTSWEGPLYEVHAVAPDMGWHMRCEVYRVAEYEGVLAVDDPDGIVVEAEFVPAALLDERLATCAPWVREPLAAWLTERWELEAPHRQFHFEVRGTVRNALHVTRH
jgi:8-oxo-dGTP pyrophosphatase MutT (NUDIX family)